MKKIVSLLLLVMFLLLAACSSDGSSTTSSSDGNDSNSNQSNDNDGGSEPTKLTVWSFVETYSDYYKYKAEEWNKEYPDRQIELQAELLPFSDMWKKLTLSLQSGKGAPDLVDIEVQKFANYLQGDTQLAPLNDIINPDDYIESRLNLYAKDGNYYGAPNNLASSVMFYNMDIMDEAGVHPDDIETWDDFVEAGKTVKETTGKPMFTVPTSDPVLFQELILQRGSDLFDEEGNVTITNQTNIDMLQFLHDSVYKDEIAIPSPGGGPTEESYFGFMNNNGVAANLMPEWYIDRFLNYMPDLEDKILIRPMPTCSDADCYTSVGIGGTGTAVIKQSEHVELAKEFLQYTKTTKESVLGIYTHMGKIPPMHVYDNEVFNETTKFTEFFLNENVFDVIEVATETVIAPNVPEDYPKGVSAIQDAIFNVIQNNNMTPEEALQLAEEDVKNQSSSN
ncbi:extracellular solute-binding protein [Aquibacillus koreensis]|uniref:Extracellular solute-binding protein n=1 Tax=Aquibacillus koreensis TaxID=279446 RepID=A0A9X4AH42_9BACI|nr:extracellular solute-binding protein [Aquibacillus koreensis]MCT2534798.1 extracellular solute-binding protein [Aquibacillus koreensis]MDC3419591.1 extracellular solute-binding protein [Aquibacillus koreensis]